MQNSTARLGSRGLRAFAAVAAFAVSTTAFARDDGYVLYLSEYLYGDYYYAPLGDVDRWYVRPIRPRQLRLPQAFRDSVEIGNADVSSNGRRIVFAARQTSDYDWDIYTGSIDLRYRRIRDVELLAADDDSRDEDPRFSWDGTRVVYKCNGNICVTPDHGPSDPLIASWCELWAPSFDPGGYQISYTERCGDSTTDRIFQYNVLTGERSIVPNNAMGPDRFAHFMADGSVIYSHVDLVSGTSSLWSHRSGVAELFHDRTESDDDPYPDKYNPNHIAFIGWENGGYNLFIHRRWRGDSVRLTYGLPILAPVLFR